MSFWSKRARGTIRKMLGGAMTVREIARAVSAESPLSEDIIESIITIEGHLRILMPIPYTEPYLPKTLIDAVKNARDFALYSEKTETKLKFVQTWLLKAIVES